MLNVVWQPLSPRTSLRGTKQSLTIQSGPANRRLLRASAMTGWLYRNAAMIMSAFRFCSDFVRVLGTSEQPNTEHQLQPCSDLS
ncbi:MAG: hypothetical protein JWR38_1354 [Mucilaginibacter sp.]|nr:hypothetical protein [Mucilaginibacter sp.]